MANPIAEGRKYLSEVLAGQGAFEHEQGIDYYFARVGVVAGSATPVEPIGQVLVWNGTNFELYVDQDISAIATDSTLPDGAPVCVSVGAKEGLGFNKEDVTLDTAPVELTVVFRGPAGILSNGLEWDGGSGAPEQAAFSLQMEKQGVAVDTTADQVVPTYL